VRFTSLALEDPCGVNAPRVTRQRARRKAPASAEEGWSVSWTGFMAGPLLRRAISARVPPEAAELLREEESAR
jgi:hypothetical protein